MIKKLILAFILIAISVVGIAPLVIYKITNDQIEKPAKPSVLIESTEVKGYWVENDHVELVDDISSITPYWIYKWFFVSMVEEQLENSGITIKVNNISRMAGLIALNHLRNSDFRHEIGGMLNWHMTNINLGIWIQRNWSAIEIASKHKEINITKRSN